MSKELEKLEKKAKQKHITEHEDIDRIIRYLFSKPFSSFQGCSSNYESLRDDLCRGFNIFKGSMSAMTHESPI